VARTAGTCSRTATGYLATAYGLRPAPFLLGGAYLALGLGLSTPGYGKRAYARHEAANHANRADQLQGHLTRRQVAIVSSLRERALSAVSQAGMVNNLNDAFAWGIYPVLHARHRLNIAQIGALATAYLKVRGSDNVVTGALSDRIGRKWLIAAGMWVRAAAIALVAIGSTFAVRAAAVVPARHRYPPWSTRAC
jgi:predicted GNAT superfamily acetyltransferase